MERTRRETKERITMIIARLFTVPTTPHHDISEERRCPYGAISSWEIRTGSVVP
ncbi:hypothetical protein KIN20_005705 [Parelaphostrongylus tenuis]|uniref:Uncharacterized protein n=1 Tax=Parelaphostrongylus tenuis TaxID=148309 RepID=A0AAD5MT51_PARTN|nr:hypothetical protein KIN20_005705 [Parelaphostrongylus tenuis]